MAWVFLDDQEGEMNLACCLETTLLSTQQSSPNEARETRRKNANTEPHQDEEDRLVVTALLPLVTDRETAIADSTSVAVVSSDNDDDAPSMP